MIPPQAMSDRISPGQIVAPKAIKTGAAPRINQLLTKRLKLKNILASSITIVFLMWILVSIFSLFVPLLVQQGENLSLLCWNACLYIWPYANKWFSNVN